MKKPFFHVRGCWYFINWYYAAGEAARLENMVAVLLYRTCLSLTDNGYGSFRSRPLAERKNWIATDQTIGVQVIGKPGILQKHGDYTWMVSADRFLALLN